MVDQPAFTLQDIVKHVGRYPEDAFLFVREGLGVASEHVHGAETEAHRRLQKLLLAQDLDWSDLAAMYHNQQLPEPVVKAIEEAGGVDNLNRHVSGRELCWALRDFALDRWGQLAPLVLGSWNIRRTLDFGRIVFGFIDFDLMRKQDNDRLEDFEDVYNFEEAFVDVPIEPKGDTDP
jgi:uncharacterized repeat protein (TIGR04138 family)